jgi:hypothetical protein
VASITGSNFGTTRTNLLVRSEEFDNASWAKLNNVTVTANATTAPNKFITADKIVEPASSTDKPIVQSVTLIANTTYTASVYFKAAERPTILFHVRKSDYSTRFGGFFNTSTNVFTAETSGGGVLDSFTFTNVGGGWYRCSITGNIGANTAGIVTIYLANSSNNLAYTGDGTSGLLLWGAQLETGTSATAYIPTTTAAVSVFGSNWYRQDEGTVFAELQPQTTTNHSHIGFDDGGNERWRIGWLTANASNLVMVDGGTVQVNTQTSSNDTWPINARRRAAAAYKTDDIAMSLQGGIPITDTSAALPTPVKMTIGIADSAAQMTGTIGRLTYWPQRLSNETLQRITQ